MSTSIDSAGPRTFDGAGTTEDGRHQIDLDGDVWALYCACGAHSRDPKKGKGHDARPIGNVFKDPSLIERVGPIPR